MTLLPPLPVYRTDLFRPQYRPFQSSRWRLHIAGMVLCPGYWSPPQLVTDMAALMRIENGVARTWMSMTPLEIESQELGCRHATGHVVVMGLGMGWAAANAALNPAVTRVTVVEFDPEIIEAVRCSAVIEQLPPEASSKITVLLGDAYEFVPEIPADTLMADIWLPLFGAERDQELRRMHANTGGAKVYFWGQEMVIADRARQAGLALTAETVGRIIADMALPLIGPAECPDYPDLISRVAAKWLKPRA
ncbi:MAG: hypothetical protein WCF85_11875 [Rhodospirillaceae bacterium]